MFSIENVIETQYPNAAPDFSDCLDAFVIAYVEKFKAKKRKRYMGE